MSRLLLTLAFSALPVAVVPFAAAAKAAPATSDSEVTAVLVALGDASQTRDRDLITEK
jgi:hypothetical protein